MRYPNNRLLLTALPVVAAALLLIGRAFAVDGPGQTKDTELQGTTASSKPDPQGTQTSLACGPPDYECSYDGVDPKPLCTDCALPPVPDMSAEPNAVWYDKTFGRGEGNPIVRCTYPDMNGRNNFLYAIGSGGSGDSHGIGVAEGSPPSYRLVLGDTHGGSFAFTFVADPVHPKCHPTYSMWSFTVGDGAFSWITPHLYYEFRDFKVKTLDLGSPKPPKRIPVLDFRQILPRDGPDWPGAGQSVPLGTIIRPRSDNRGKCLYQASCHGGHPDCSAGKTGDTPPKFHQGVMTNSPDGTVLWRNIGPGFKSAATWSTIGGLSANDDVLAQGFSDAKGQGGIGAIFVVAYRRSTNTYYLNNVGTGIVSYFRCKNGSGFRCSGGSWQETILGVTSLPDRFLLHNVKVNKSGEWVVIVQEECKFSSCWIVPGSFGPYFWKLSTTEAKVNKVISHPLGHWTEGFKLFANVDAEPGAKLSGRSYEDAASSFVLNNTPTPNLPTLGGDEHPSWNYNDGSDKTPICTEVVGFDWPYTVPYENEVVCYGTNPDPDCSMPGHALCRNVTKRFFHTYNPFTCDQNEGFWGCWGIGVLSQDGKYYAFTSNWGDTLGSISTGGHGPGSCRGGFNFQPNHLYHVGDVFEPANGINPHPNASFNVYRVTVAGSSAKFPHGAWPTGWRLKRNRWQGFYQIDDTVLPRGANPCQHAFRVTSGGGTPNGSDPPNWKKAYHYEGSCSSVTSGATIADGGITWTDIGEYVLGTMHLENIGHDDCRSDVFIGALR
jgi:hypothetical protein